MSTDQDSVEQLAAALKQDDQLREELAEEIVQRMDVDGDTPEGQSAQAYRRDVLKGLGVLGTGAALGGAGGMAATQGARAGSQQSGTIGTSSDPVDVIAEDIYGPGGQGSGDAVAFESVETDEGPAKVVNAKPGDDLQTKANNAAGGTLRLAPGTYSASDVTGGDLDLSDMNVVVEGAGKGNDQTVLEDIPVVIENSGQQWGQQVRNLFLDGLDKTGVGISVSAARRTKIADTVRVSRWDRGVQISNSWGLDWVSLHARNNTDNVALDDTVVSGGITTQRFFGGYVDKADNFGIHCIGGVNTVTFYGTVIEGCDTHEVVLESVSGNGEPKQVGFHRCYFENRNSTHTFVDTRGSAAFTSDQTTFDNCKWTASDNITALETDADQRLRFINNDLSGPDIQMTVDMSGSDGEFIVRGNTGAFDDDWNWNVLGTNHRFYDNDPEATIGSGLDGLVNGYGSEDAGSGNTPTASKWKPGDIVENADDGVIYVLGKDGSTWTQIS